MKALLLTILALLAAGLLVLAWTAGARVEPAPDADRSGRTGARPAEPDAAIDARIARLESDLAALADQVRLLRSRSDLAQVGIGGDMGGGSAEGERRALPSPADEAAAAAEVRALRERLETLELELARLRRDARLGGSARSPELGGSIARDPTGADGPGALAAQAGLDEWARRANDPGIAERDRLDALRRLRGKRNADGTDARLAAVQGMVELARYSENASTRADVWRQLSGVTDPGMRQALLDALRDDPSPEVREEAAETLADFLPDAAVQAALQWAADNDPDADVRAQAFESLGGRRS